VNDRFNFFTFTNANSVGSTQLYRIVLRSLSGQVNVAFNIITLADTDRDGLPDVWETQFGFDPANAADRNLDFDGDGLSNWQEYTAGTDPTNSASFLRVSVAAVANQAVISFGASSNKTYTIQFSDRISTGQWAKLADVLARPNNRVETIIDPAWTTNRFYRAVTPRQP
jgi:hypothetical protein